MILTLRSLAAGASWGDAVGTAKIRAAFSSETKKSGGDLPNP